MKNNAKKTLLIVGSLCSMVVICVVFGFLGKNEEDVIINRLVGIVAIISGLGSLLMGVSSLFSTSLDNVREYYATGDTTEMSNARYVIYNYRYIKMKYGKSLFDEDFDEWCGTLAGDAELKVTNREEILNAAGLILNFFQMWGLLQSKGFLPIWVFETASGYSIIKLHEGVEDILIERRDTNPFYGMQFTDLCERIARKNKKAIAQCRAVENGYIMQELGLSKAEVDAWHCKKVK